ncbi:hypothetical protein AB0J30_38945, partial [Streptomyces microflavus]|uniref:hypothetical protein n=1 Tax=Streptomyces microflavus TaxID=1919 RepID=UPI003437799B
GENRESECTTFRTRLVSLSSAMGTGTRLPSELNAINYRDRRLTQPIKNGQRKRAKATTNLNPPHAGA